MMLFSPYLSEAQGLACFRNILNLFNQYFNKALSSIEAMHTIIFEKLNKDATLIKKNGNYFSKPIILSKCFNLLVY